MITVRPRVFDQGLVEKLRAMPVVSEDARRIVREYTDPALGLSIQHFFVKDGSAVLGNHFHLQKHETFQVVAGRVKVAAFRNTQTLEHFALYDLSPGEVFTVHPGTAHVFVCEPGTEIICLSTKPFDPADMIPYAV